MIDIIRERGIQATVDAGRGRRSALKALHEASHLYRGYANDLIARCQTAAPMDEPEDQMRAFFERQAAARRRQAGELTGKRLERREAVAASKTKQQRFSVNREVDRRVPQTRSAAESEMLTAKDLEALLKIDVKTIYSYVRRGLIPYVRIQSNVRFVKRQIFDWIGEHNYRPQPANGNGAKRRSQ